MSDKLAIGVEKLFLRHGKTLETVSILAIGLSLLSIELGALGLADLSSSESPLVDNPLKWFFTGMMSLIASSALYGAVYIGNHAYTELQKLDQN